MLRSRFRVLAHGRWRGIAQEPPKTARRCPLAAPDFLCGSAATAIAGRGNLSGETQMGNNPNDRKEQEKRQQEQQPGTQRQDEQRQHQQDPNRQGQQNPADRQSQIDRDGQNPGQNPGQGNQQKR